MRFLHRSIPLWHILLACALAEALNLFGIVVFFYKLHIPLFLDTIGTVAVTFYAGLLPGLTVALLHNIVWTLIQSLVTGSAIYPWEMLYSLCGMTIAFITWFFSRKKSNFSFSFAVTALYIVLIAIVSAFASSLLGGFIEFVNRILFNGLAYKSATEHFVSAFLGQHFGIFVSCVLARIPMTMFDRIVCTFAGYAVYKICDSYDSKVTYYE